MRTYDNCFDFLRFLFASIVMIGHLIVITELPQLQGLYPYFDTYISITGFFVISGFLITQSYMRSQSVSSYFLKRAKRLLPAYVLVVVVCAAGLAGLSAYSPAEYYTDPGLYRYLIANLSFLNFVHPCLPGCLRAMCLIALSILLCGH